MNSQSILGLHSKMSARICVRERCSNQLKWLRGNRKQTETPGGNSHKPQDGVKSRPTSLQPVIVRLLKINIPISLQLYNPCLPTVLLLPGIYLILKGTCFM